MKIKKTAPYIEKLLTKRVSFYPKLNDKQQDELWDLLSDYERYRIQLKNQKKVGLGKDKFILNEYACEQVPLGKYKNLK